MDGELRYLQVLLKQVLGGGEFSAHTSASLPLGKTPPLLQCYCLWIWFDPRASFDASDKIRVITSDHRR
jgi:hypothetical protein